MSKSNFVYEISIGLNKQIGSTGSLEKRMDRHLKFLIKGVHWNSYMQNSYNLYNSFSYTILSEHETRKEGYKIEQELLDIHYGTDKYMMLNPKACGGSNKGFGAGKKLSQEHCKKISNSLKGQRLSEERIKKIKESNIKFRRENPNHMKGYRHSEESRKKMSASGKHRSDIDTIKDNFPSYRIYCSCIKCRRKFDIGNYTKHVSYGCKYNFEEIRSIIRDFERSKEGLSTFSKKNNIGIKLLRNLLKFVE